MEMNPALDCFAALAQPMRLSAFRLLVRAGPEGMAAGEISEALDVRENTLSANLSVLAGAGLVARRREGRSIRYFADLTRMRHLVDFLLSDCCGGNPALCRPAVNSLIQAPVDLTPPRPPFNVLFLCTANSARSLIAEAILKADPSLRFRAFSAGSHPSGQANPLALRLLKRLEYSVGGLRSKSWDEFKGPDAPRMDMVITVCDRAAGEICPVWSGQPLSAHWPVPDPVAEGGEDAFQRAHDQLAARIASLTALPVESSTRAAIEAELNRIGADECHPAL